MTEIKEKFVIDDDLKAEWALKKIKEIKEEETRLLNLVSQEKCLLDKKEEEIKNKSLDQIKYFSGLLEEYLKENDLAVKETKTKSSYSLLTGDLIIKKPSKSIIKADEIMLLENLQGTQYIENIPKLKWGEYKKNLIIQSDNVIDKTTGEIVAGVEILEKEEEFEIKIK